MSWAGNLEANIIFLDALRDVSCLHRISHGQKARSHDSRNWSGPNNFCKETVQFLRGHRWPREKLTVSIQKLSGPDQFCDESGPIFAVA